MGISDQSLQIIIGAKDNASKVIKGISASLAGLNSSFEKSVTASQQFGKVMTVATVAATAFGVQGLKMAADVETATVGLTTLLGSAKAAGETIALVKKVAVETPFEVKGLAQATQLLSSVTHNGPASVKILSDIGEGLVAMGKGNEELDRIIINLQQVGAIGHASMVDIKQFAYAGIPIFDMLKNSIGLTGSALDDFISNGGVTFEMLTGMFDKANDAGGIFFNAYKNNAGSFNQIYATMRESISLFLSDLVTQTGAFDFAKTAMKGFSDFITAHKAEIVAFLVSVSTYLKENKDVAVILAGVILGALAPAFIALAIAIGGAVIALAPFMLAGGLIAGIFVFHKEIQAMLTTIDENTGLITLFGWAWSQISATFTTSLLPALHELWVALQPLLPILTVLAKLIGVTLLVGIYALTLAITGWIEMITAVITIGVRFSTAIVNFFVTPINKFLEVVKEAYSWINKLISRMGDLGVSNLGSKAIKGVGNLLGFEHGGTVPGAVGTAVPIIAHGQEQIIPAGSAKGSGGGVYNFMVTINNPVLPSQAASNQLRKDIDDAVRDLVRVHKLQTI